MALLPHKSWHPREAPRTQMSSGISDRSRGSTMSWLGSRQRRRVQMLSRSCVHWLELLVLLMLVPDFIVALKDVSVMIPQAVKRGSNALFTCNYDMENDTLYSVKWYKGKREFYRYTPKENPAMKVFPMTSGLNVERNLSNQSHVVLQSVPLNISGKFTCEISVEAPTFQTAMVSGEMEVVELPEEHTVVTGIQARYRIGDLVDGNCSIKYSKPAANLTWTINGIVVPPHHIKTYQIEKLENSTLESVTSAIHFMVTTQHFVKGQMRLKCTANIFDIFKEEIESIIEEDRPRIMASGRSYDINNYPLEEHGNGIGERDRERGYEDHNESYLTYYSPENSASGAARSAHEVFWRFWLLRIAELLPLQQITKLHRHIDRQLAEWAWQMDMTDSDGGRARCSGAAAALSIPLWLWGAHQIINCQYGSDKAATQQQMTTSARRSSSSWRSTGNGDCIATDVDVTMSKAGMRGDKCFYNCQMALATLWGWHAGNPFLYLAQGFGNAQQRDDEANGEDDQNDGSADDAGNIVSVAELCDDLTATAGAAAGAAASVASAATSPLKRQHQQLSATLAKVGVPVSPDQRLLMTWHELAGQAVRISC